MNDGGNKCMMVVKNEKNTIIKKNLKRYLSTQGFVN